MAVSGDGSVIVGWADVGGLPEQAFIWDAEHGMRGLKDVLQGQYGLDLAGWNLFEATGISDDGQTIVGYGSGPAANFQAFRVTLPEPGSIALLLPAAVLSLRRRHRGH